MKKVCTSMSHSKWNLSLLIALMILLVPTQSQQAFKINDYTTNFQRTTATAKLSNGNIVVAWHGSCDPSSSAYEEVSGRIVKSDGTYVTGDFLISETYNSAKSYVKLVALTNGGFVAVWADNEKDGSNTGIRARIFNNEGTPTTLELGVNIQTSSEQTAPSAALLSNGDIMIVWSDRNTWDIMGRRLKSDGTFPSGSDITIATDGSRNLDLPTVVAQSNGGYFVTYTSNPGGHVSIFGQFMDSSDSTVGSELTLLSKTNKNFNNPKAALLSNGNIAIAFTYTPSAAYVYFVIINSAGTIVKSLTKVSVANYFMQQEHNIVSLTNGAFVITFIQNESPAKLYRRAFKIDGTAIDSKETLITEISGSNPFATTVLSDKQIFLSFQTELDDTLDSYGIVALGGDYSVDEAGEADEHKKDGISAGIMFVIIFFPTVVVVGVAIWAAVKYQVFKKCQKRSKTPAKTELPSQRITTEGEAFSANKA